VDKVKWDHGLEAMDMAVAVKEDFGIMVAAVVV
jgi:hypothetical protein